MRTGKTMSSLWATDILFLFGKIRKVLIISPLSTIKIVWGANIFENLPHRSYSVAHGTKDARIRAIRAKVDYVIINHDGIKSCWEELIAENFDIIIIDELTAFKNANNDRSKIMQKIASTVKAVWGMTGNPTPNSPSEAFGQGRVVNPGNPELPRYFTKFRSMVEHEVGPYMWVPRPQAKDVVYKVLQPSIRFTRAECFDIPPVMHRNVNLPMSAEQQKVYDEVKDELYHEYDKGEITIVNAAVKFSKLLQICAGAVKDDMGNVYYLDDTPKIDQILQTFEETGNTKLVVASAFRASVERVCQILNDKKIKSKFIHGGVSSNMRSDIMLDFQKGETQILVVQPQAVAHGTDFSVAYITVWHSLISSGEVYGQMNDRIVNASQKNKQYIEHLISSKADLHALNIVTRKEDMSGGFLKLFETKDL